MLKQWIPVVLWAALIFNFSTDAFSSSNTSSIIQQLISWLLPGITARQIDISHQAIRKFGHWAEYFVLSVLLLRALQSEWRIHWYWRPAGWTLVLVLSYAAS